MRVALLSGHARAGDALGQQLAEKTSFFLDHGADVQVFLEDDRRLHPALKQRCRPWPPSEKERHFLETADLILVDYGQRHLLHDGLPMLAATPARIVFDYHGVTPPELWPEHRDELSHSERQRGLVWFADAALVHSRFAADELRQASGFLTERCFTIGYPVDTGWFSPGPPTSSWRDRLGLAADDVLLLYVGRVAPNKDLPTLVEALAQEPRLHALVIGDTSDRYQAEAERCRALANLWGVAQHLHMVGPVDGGSLRDAYRSADLFVMPSRHEAFCIPVVEAQASGLPVVAARAGALPETVGDGGLTFRPGDPHDLVRQVRRVIGDQNRDHGGLTPPARQSFRVAVVACRYGTDFVGGAEKALRTIAETLQGAGHHVEAFATCLRGESGDNQTAAGDAIVQGVPVHRFPADAVNEETYQRAAAAITFGQANDQVEQDYLNHSVRSRALLLALRQRIHEFDAIIVGPYLFGLTVEVAREFPAQTLLFPCFHDEPPARLEAFRDAYAQVGGILYQTPEEQAFAEAVLGLNHPGRAAIGTVIDTQAGDSARGQSLTGSDRKLIVYCGRYSQEKNVPLILEYAEQYASLHPERFHFVFVGEGGVQIPAADWACDLGFVDDASRRDVMSAASALVQLSRRESLSLTALEAWAQGVPVLANAGCAVLAGHIGRNQAGWTVTSYDEFAAVLDEVWQRPEQAQARGMRGRDYVRERYAEPKLLADQLLEAIRGLTVPLVEQMRQRGLERAARHQREAWRQQFGHIIEHVLDLPKRSLRTELVVEARAESRQVTVGTAAVLVPVRIVNRGTAPVLADGPLAVCLRSRLMDGAGKAHAGFTIETPLPEMVLPGQAVPAAVEIAIPDQPGTYRLGLRAERADRPLSAETWIELRVEAKVTRSSQSLIELAQAALAAAAARLQRLPDGYHDVSEGLLAGLRKQVKHRLLNNFKRAYVDVLSRQQSAFNRQVLCALHEVVECCGVLEHAVQQHPISPQPAPRLHDDLVKRLLSELADSQKRIAELEERLARLEERVLEKVEVEA